MRRREGVELFSTSAIDLLACGLGAVLVLWLLVFGNEGGAMDSDRPLGGGEMRIRQFGPSHFVGFEINGYTLESLVRVNIDGVRETVNPTKFDASVAFASESFCSHMGERWRLHATYVEPSKHSKIEVSCRAFDEFDHQIAVNFSDMRSAHEVGLTIQTCGVSEVHYLEMQSIDRRGVNVARYVFQCNGDAEAALKKDPPRTSEIPPRNKWEEFFRSQIKEEIERMCPTDSWDNPFNYMVFDCTGSNIGLSMGVKFTGDGAVRFVPPDPNPVAPEVATILRDDIRSLIVSWSHGKYGERRPALGLPPCPP